VLLQYALPEDEDWGEGLGVGEIVRVVDRFQAVALYEQSVQQFREGLKVGNVVEQLMLAHDSRLGALEETGIGFFEANTIVFQVRLQSSVFYANLCVSEVLFGTKAP